MTETPTLQERWMGYLDEMDKEADSSWSLTALILDTVKELDSLRAATERAEAETARIDWLEAEALRHKDGETGESFYALPEDLLRGWAMSFRAAIDAARSPNEGTV